MTGFSSTDWITDDINFSLELKSVNGRGLDLRTRLPTGFEDLEKKVKSILGASIKRGNISLNLRMDLKESSKDFKINIKEKFKHSFGIISVDEGDPETVELSFTRKQGEYIKTYPLHESQQVVFENNEEIRVKLLIYVTYDFIMELLSFGSEMKVISPADLQEEIQESLEEALKNYTA